MVMKRSITSQDVLERLYMLFLVGGVPEHIRSDNGPEFTSRAVRGWLSSLGVKAMFIEPGSPWENGYVESFNGKFRDELLNREVISTLTEARILIEWWRKEYNQVRPHSSLGYLPPAPQTILPTMAYCEVIPGTITGVRSCYTSLTGTTSEARGLTIAHLYQRVCYTSLTGTTSEEQV